MTCSDCPGSILQKPVFEDYEALGIHYILGPKAFALKELYEKEFPKGPFPVACPDQYGWARCKEELTDWVHTVLHFGIQHQRLFYITTQDRYNNHYDITLRLFPYHWHHYHKMLGKD